MHLYTVKIIKIKIKKINLKKALRTSWSFYSKYIINDIKQITSQQIGYMNTSFLLLMGFGLYFFGGLGDKISAKKYLMFGIILSALFVFMIPIFYFLGIYSPIYFIILQGLNGLFESTAQPGSMRLLGTWFSSQHRGILLGIWSGSRSFGDVQGLYLSHIIINKFSLQWNYGLIIQSFICFLISYLIYKQIINYPEEIGLKIQQETTIQQESLQLTHQKTHISISQAFYTIPGLFWHTLTMMFLKALNYGILFWYPKFLQDIGLKQQSSYIAIFCSVGVLLGGIISGWIGDKIDKKRGILIPPSLFLLVICLYFFSVLNQQNDSILHFYFYSFFIGFFLGGPYNVHHGPLVVDLGQHESLKNNKEAIGRVTGIIEGAACISSAIVQIVIPYYGENNIFKLFIIISLGSIGCIWPVAVSDYKYFKNKYNNYSLNRKKIENLKNDVKIQNLQHQLIQKY
ncbi:major facilitator superfamily protein, putative [Ichthyophthirius multifiliis]|uniref:Major facilitator superfamily protein, putative n=1 Tax=Ichthyophthirius multifiliis TaxID=5932 RepID=G0QXX9_ICHMU|nr:major facilitator superfamily protein, putative [Ichthyophthirius multifiliis]EGR29931.1 major facilitator superfamily protein, putative [Ichthyophthirius multifiliis]|eukprot:XP_004031167.1 major facilitator superfamily protein, putative [Ichthyophthirius multifiliis]